MSLEPMTEFTAVPKAKSKIVAAKDSRAVFDKTLEENEKIIKDSDLLKQINDQLKDTSIDRIRCLGLGSPSNDFPAMYQLALLRALVHHYEVKDVSVYDPVFSELDLEYFAKWEYKVEPELALAPKETLFFLPHAPLGLTQDVFITEQPYILLGNDLVTHVDRYTKSQLKEKYPVLSKVVHLIKGTNTVQDDFQTVKKKRNRKKSTAPAQVTYEDVETYVKQVEIHRLPTEGVWLNSFSDLALHTIS